MHVRGCLVALVCADIPLLQGASAIVFMCYICVQSSTIGLSVGLAILAYSCYSTGELTGTERTMLAAVAALSYCFA